MKTLRSLQFAFAMLMLAFAAACTTAATPDTFNKRVAVAYTTVQTLNESAAVAITAGKLTKADGANVVATSRAALQAIDVAVQIHVTNATAGEDKLAAALTVLTALQAYLATQGVK